MKKSLTLLFILVSLSSFGRVVNISSNAEFIAWAPATNDTAYILSSFETTSRKLIASKQNVLVEGVGFPYPEIYTTRTSDYIFGTNGTTKNVIFKNMRLRGYYIGGFEDTCWSTPASITLFNSGATIENIEISYTRWGIRSTNSDTNYKNDLIIKNVEIHHTYDDCIFVTYGGNVSLIDSYIHHFNLGYWKVSETLADCNGGDGIQVERCLGNIYIHNNKIDKRTSGGKFCVIVGNYSDTRKFNCEISNNVLIARDINVTNLETNTDGHFIDKSNVCYFKILGYLILKDNQLIGGSTAVHQSYSGSTNISEISGNYFYHNVTGINIGSNWDNVIKENTFESMYSEAMRSSPNNSDITNNLFIDSDASVFYTNVPRTYMYNYSDTTIFGVGSKLYIKQCDNIDITPIKTKVSELVNIINTY